MARSASGTGSGAWVSSVTRLLRHAHARDDLRIGQRGAALGLFDLAGAGEQRIEVAIFGDQLRRGLDADARRAGHVVGGVAGQRLHVDDLLRRRALPALHHLGAVQQPLRPVARLALDAGFRIVEGNRPVDELHQILVGGHDGDVGAGRDCLTRIAGDQIVGLVALQLDRLEPEGAHRGADQRKLRHEVGGRFLPVGLVGGIDLLAERLRRLVEDDDQMRRLDAERAVAHELEQLDAEQPHRADRQAVGARIVLAVLVDRLEVGAEHEGGAVDQEDVVAGADAGRGAVGRRAGSRFGHVESGRKLPGS